MDTTDCSADDHAVAAKRSSVTPAVRDRAARMLSAAGDAGRLHLLELLQIEPMCVTDLAIHTGESMPGVSQRLRILKAEGLVSSERDGKHIYYTLADEHVRDLLSNILRHAAEAPRS